MLFKIANYMDL